MTISMISSIGKDYKLGKDQTIPSSGMNYLTVMMIEDNTTRIWDNIFRDKRI